MANKKEANERKKTLKQSLAKAGYKMPHGYEVTVRKKAVKKKK